MTEIVHNLWYKIGQEKEIYHYCFLYSIKSPHNSANSNVTVGTKVTGEYRIWGISTYNGDQNGPRVFDIKIVKQEWINL